MADLASGWIPCHRDEAIYWMPSGMRPLEARYPDCAIYGLVDDTGFRPRLMIRREFGEDRWYIRNPSDGD